MASTSDTRSIASVEESESSPQAVGAAGRFPRGRVVRRRQAKPPEFTRFKWLQTGERGVEDRLNVVRVGRDLGDGDDHVEDLVQTKIGLHFPGVLSRTQQGCAGGEANSSPHRPGSKQRSLRRPPR